MFSFTLILSGLRAVIAAGAARDRAFAAILSALHARIGRMAQRLDRLIARWRAGTLPPPRPSRLVETRAAQAAPAVRFPCGKGWVRARLGAEISAHASQLLHQLSSEECQAFLAACPQAGRILRPLLRMLTFDPLPAMVRPVAHVARAVTVMVGLTVGVAPASQILDA